VLVEQRDGKPRPSAKRRWASPSRRSARARRRLADPDRRDELGSIVRELVEASTPAYA
jgi:hypothetical protein